MHIPMFLQCLKNCTPDAPWDWNICNKTPLGTSDSSYGWVEILPKFPEFQSFPRKNPWGAFSMFPSRPGCEKNADNFSADYELAPREVRW